MNEKPNWEQLRKDQPFQVPERYFDSVALRIVDRIHQPEPALPWYRVVTVTAKPYFALATLFIGIFAAIMLFVKDQGASVTSNPQTAQAVQTNQILEHLMDNTDAMELMSFDMASAGTVENTQRTASSTSTDKNTEDIINFLMQENIEVAAIVDAL